MIAASPPKKGSPFVPADSITFIKIHHQRRGPAHHRVPSLLRKDPSMRLAPSAAARTASAPAAGRGSSAGIGQTAAQIRRSVKFLKLASPAFRTADFAFLRHGGERVKTMTADPAVEFISRHEPYLSSVDFGIDRFSNLKRHEPSASWGNPEAEPRGRASPLKSPTFRNGRFHSAFSAAWRRTGVLGIRAPGAPPRAPIRGFPGFRARDLRRRLQSSMCRDPETRP